MTRMFDARVPVAFGPLSEAGDGDAVLAGPFGPAPGHSAGCACCAPRAPAAEALSRLFTQRARGEVAFFRRVLVVADEADASAVRTALASDPVASARFRLA